MKYAKTVDFDINTFEFWASTRGIIKQVRKEDLLEEAAVCIETAFEDETPTEIQINEYVWNYLEDDLWEIYNKALWSEKN